MKKMKLLQFFFFIVVICIQATYGVHAQPYPNKQPVKLIVGFTPGSTIDTVGRLMAEELHKSLGGTFIVDNRSGAVGVIGSDFVARSPADGYTLIVSSGSTHSAAPWMFKKLSYDPVADFTHIGRWLQQPYLLVVHPNFPAKNFNEFIEKAKSNSGKLAFGYGSSSSQIGATSLMALANFQALGVGYKSQPPALADLLAERIQFMVADVAVALPLVNSGKLRALAVTSLQRSSHLPDVVTIAESGFPGFGYTTWMGLAGPANMPREVTEKINTETARLLSRPEIRRRFISLGLDVVPNSVEDHQEFIKNELVIWRKRIIDARIEPE